VPFDTRARIVSATSELFRRQGMAGTGLKQITKTADAPFGSLYHFFPGGKAQLAEEVIRTSGKMYFDLVMQFFDACTDLPAGIETAFTAAAELLVETDYADACPIATIALEVASTDETLRVATADVFADWIDAGARRLVGSGLPEASRRRLMIGIITSLEGAFILCRALRSTEPLEAASRTVLHAVRAELSEHFTGHAQPPG
jgi:AcrR family transcriptional regulator